MTTLNLDTLHLDHGQHDGPDDGHCLLEAASMFAKEPFTDEPKCVSPVLREFGIGLNDQWGDVQRQTLRPFIPRIVGTANDGLDEARSYLALDWLIRTYTPAWLDLAGLTAAAAELRGLRRIVDMAAADAAGPVVRAAGGAARVAAAAWAVAGPAARSAAWDAARDAAGSAARHAAGSAAWDDAGDAAWAAAWAAARSAARDAAKDAAGSAAGPAARAGLQPTVDMLQASALNLFDAMIRPDGAR